MNPRWTSIQNILEAEWDELEEYCWHDVEGFVHLYKASGHYLEGQGDVGGNEG